MSKLTGLEKYSVILGGAVRWYRRHADMTQKALGLAIGTDGPTVSKLERGRGNPTLKRLADLAETLHVPLARLFLPPPPSILPVYDGQSSAVEETPTPKDVRELREAIALAEAEIHQRALRRKLDLAGDARARRPRQARKNGR